MASLRVTSADTFLFNEGTLFEAYKTFGAHPEVHDDGTTGVRFVVWAPHADYVSVVGDMNGWDRGAHPLYRHEGGVWERFVPGAHAGQAYKYHIGAPGFTADKTDPFARALEPPADGGDPVAGLSSIVQAPGTFAWTDEAWMNARKGPGGLSEPMAVYEVHAGSWKRHYDGRRYSYREMAAPLIEHCHAFGFTHVEFMPVAEHPYYGSWGYQIVGFYAATHLYGSPDDLRGLVDALHNAGIGVIFDWVPAHFAVDPQGLGLFDGRPLFEPDDERMRTHPDWGTFVFDYERGGVRSFLVSNALYWLDEFHADGLRVDAVASMLYRDYSRGDTWTPNRYGGRENLEAISLLQAVNTEVYRRYPTAMTIAEESTAWPGVTRPAEWGGLGFLYKWNMGWMHDTLSALAEDPVNRRYHYGAFTFPLAYAFDENWVLPLSHDEVVHLKGSLFEKMPGDDWQKAANVRLLVGHMVGHPGKKLLFMGGEFGQRREWNHDTEIDWPLLGTDLHAGIARFAADAFALYRAHPALHDDTADGFHWLYNDDPGGGTLAYVRTGRDADGQARALVVALNLTPVVRENVRLGALPERHYRQVLSSDDWRYGGSGVGTWGDIAAHPVPAHGYPGSIVVTLPPLGVAVFEIVPEDVWG